MKDKINQWKKKAPDGGDYIDLDNEIRHLSEQLFDDYDPCTSETFLNRLHTWLMNIQSDEDQKILFKLVPHIIFLSRKEFKSLHRSAFQAHVFPWLVSELGIQLNDPKLNEKLNAATKETWFCSVTDSMPIGDFCRINGLEGNTNRHILNSIIKMEHDEAQKNPKSSNFQARIVASDCKRLVLLEDFVGTGEQIQSVIQFAAQLDKVSDNPIQSESMTPLPILVIPLICCPDGMTSGKKLTKTHKNVTFSPVITLPEKAFIKRIKNIDEEKIFQDIRSFILNSPPEMQINDFGYGETGGLVVLQTNCPDNTLPLIRANNTHWKPLFPRVNRE